MHSGYALAARLSETRPRLLSGTRGPRERADITSGPRRSPRRRHGIRPPLSPLRRVREQLMRTEAPSRA